jgi:hypothetical protein
LIDELGSAERVLAVGIGGGGDVVGALAVAQLAGLLGTETVVGGLTWERNPIDPHPGPRGIDELDGAQRLNASVALAGPRTTGPGGFRFAESYMAEFLGEPVLLLDPSGGAATVADDLADAARTLGCDLVVLTDVGGDVLAHGDEAGLASPLADAVLLASSPRVEAAGIPTLGVVFGAGCDGELTPEEVAQRLDEVGGVTDLAIDAEGLDRVAGAAAVVTTEASAMALRCARGETGRVSIRNGRRTVRLTATGGRLACFAPAAALRSAARCAAAVAGAGSLAEADELLTARGVRTELRYETDMASPAGA